MKKYHIIYAIVLAALTTLLLAGCKDTDDETRSPFDNGAYLDVAEAKISETVTFKKTLTEIKKPFRARLSYPAREDVQVSLRVAPELIDRYNGRYGTSYGMLDAAYYSLPQKSVTIPAGDAESVVATIDFVKLDELEIDATYLVPLTIDAVSGGIGTLDGSKTVYYLVKRSSAITVAANMKDNYFAVPGFDTDQTGGVVDNMPAITYEAIIYVNDFAYGGPKNPDKAYISTIMGCEQGFLIRIGDTGFPLQQLQMQGPAGKFPEADNSKLLAASTWYHVALTWDIAAQTIIFYVNGQEQSRSETYGASELTSISLKKSKHGFFIGRSFNDDMRQLNGNICEARVWSVARTQKEIWDNMYDVDPHAEGLVAYWKFDEGQGNVVSDLTGNGNDAFAPKDVTWPEGIEVPQINKDE